MFAVFHEHIFADGNCRSRPDTTLTSHGLFYIPAAHLSRTPLTDVRTSLRSRLLTHPPDATKFNSFALCLPTSAYTLYTTICTAPRWPWQGLVDNSAPPRRSWRRRQRRLKLLIKPVESSIGDAATASRIARGVEFAYCCRV